MGSNGSLPHPNEPRRQEAQRLAFSLSRKQTKIKQAWMAYTMPPLLSTNGAPQDALSSSSHEIDLRSSGQEFQSSDLSRVSSYSIPGLYSSTDDASSVLDAWGRKTKTVIGKRCADDVQRTRRHDDDINYTAFSHGTCQQPDGSAEVWVTSTAAGPGRVYGDPVPPIMYVYRS